jgi:hypothetical protein
LENNFCRFGLRTQTLVDSGKVMGCEPGYENPSLPRPVGEGWGEGNFPSPFDLGMTSKNSFKNIFLAGRNPYDSIIEYERQKHAYSERSLCVLDKGHTTSAVAFGDLRKHVMESMNRNM